MSATARASPPSASSRGVRASTGLEERADLAQRRIEITAAPGERQARQRERQVDAMSGIGRARVYSTLGEREVVGRGLEGALRQLTVGQEREELRVVERLRRERREQRVDGRCRGRRGRG